MLPLFPAKSSVICSNLHAALADPEKLEKSLFLKHLSEGRLMTRQSPSELDRHTYGFGRGRTVQRNGNRSQVLIDLVRRQRDDHRPGSV